MALNYQEIAIEVSNNGLIDPFDSGKEFLQGASYDLSAGVLIWKEPNKNGGGSIIRKISFNSNLPRFAQESVTLQPGQVMFVITRETIKMPPHLYGTVYSRNKFSRDGILALTTGHIDPLVTCPIVIRLINLRSIPYTFQVGEPIFTIVFSRMESPLTPPAADQYERTISLEETINKTIESANAALDNALYDLSITHGFVRKEDFNKLINYWIKSNALKVIGAIAAILTFIFAAYDGIPKLLHYLGKMLSHLSHGG